MQINSETARLSTEQLAAQYMVKPNSIRSAYCRQGHYFGWKAEKLPNGRLVWVGDKKMNAQAQCQAVTSHKED